MALLDQLTEETSSDFYVAADVHNIANGGNSFWDTITSFENIPKFIGLGAASGINQIYNIAPSIGNWFGGNFKESDFGEVLSRFDTDLGAYYQEHKDGVDTLGFVLGSFVPGMAGVKALRAGQTAARAAVESGNVGANFSRVTGLLAPNRAANVTEATKQLIAGNSPFSLQHKSVLAALRAGAGQAALETAAFEGAVAATMFNSPILEEQSKTDLLTNMLFAGAIGTTIGGVLDGVRSVSQIKKGLKAFDTEASPWTYIEKGSAIATPAEKLALYNHQRLGMPSVVPGAENAAKLAELGATKKAKLEQLIRAEFQTLTGNDTVLADVMTKDFLAKGFDDSISNVWELQAATRLSKESREERLLGFVSKGKFDDKMMQELYDSTTSYIRFYGDDIGKVTDEVPAVSYLGDSLPAKSTVELVAQGAKINGKLHAVKRDKFDFFKASENQLEIRTAWARKYLDVTDDVVIRYDDIPMLDAAFGKGALPKIDVNGTVWRPATQEEFLENLITYKKTLAQKLLDSTSNQLPVARVAKMVNVKENWLTGTLASREVTDDVFADLSNLAAYKKLTGDTARNTLLDVPSTVKLGYRKQNVTSADGFVLEGMEAILRQEQLYKQDAERVAAAVLGEELVPLNTSDIMRADRMGAGASFLTFASGNYGSLASLMEYAGSRVTSIIQRKRDAVADTLKPFLYKLTTDTEAALEWSTLTQKVRGSQHTWKLLEDGSGLRIYEDDLYAAAQEAGEEATILFNSPTVADLARANIELNATRVSNLKAVRSVQGLEDGKRADAFYTAPPNPKNYPFFAFVTDPTVTGTGHTKMLYAATEQDLKNQIAAVRTQFPEFRVLEKGEAEQYYKAIGQFDYEKTLSDNYIDTALKRKGVSERFLPLTDPKVIAEELLDWHLRSEAGVVREAASAFYEPQFAALRQLGEQYTLAATSRYGGKSLSKYAESSVANPYTDYIKVALGINTAHEYPFWMPVQKMFEQKVSSLFGAIKSTWQAAPTLAGLERVNQQLLDAGYKGAAYDAMLAASVNTGIPQAALSKYIQHSNAALSFFALRSDPLNALNNVIGNNVLLNTEIRSVLRNIENANSDAAGELAALAKLTVPGTDKQILSHSKLIGRAISAFHSRNDGTLQFFKDKGFITDIRAQYMQSLDDLAIRSTDTIVDVESRSQVALATAKKWAGTAEKYSANSLAEEFNRFVSAHVMKDITDLAVKHGVMDDKSALAYINTFVNRTQGNFLAAQRPMLFQGPVGQAIGLFQTYQFNLIQQLLRHVAEGSKKDSAMLLGLQGSIYGMNGLPAFNAINTHIVGTAKGNTENKDIQHAVYSGVGKDAGDWLMYGLASNMFLHPDLKMNMYTRGDINPRHVTVVPTNPADVPFINAQIKFFGNVFDTLTKMDNTGNTANLFLQGLQNNGLSRPLAGLAQTMQAATNPQGQVLNISKQGNIIGSNDFLSLMTLGRMAGAKPLDEAIVQDTTFRMKAYAANKASQLQSLGKDVKSTLFAGGAPTQEQIEGFMDKYVELGGKQTEFNKFMLRQYTNATKSQAEQMRDTLSKPYARSLQEIMGGVDPTPMPEEP